MLTNPTIEKLQALRLTAMAEAFDQQRSSSQYAELPFEDRLGAGRTNGPLAPWRRAALRHMAALSASLEDVDFSARGLNREAV
jgi:hypothetical protein